jgi:hypothetical protein
MTPLSPTNTCAQSLGRHIDCIGPVKTRADGIDCCDAHAFHCITCKEVYHIVNMEPDGSCYACNEADELSSSEEEYIEELT